MLSLFQRQKFDLNMSRKSNKRKSSVRSRYGKRRKRGGFLNRYYFADTGGDTINQLSKIAPVGIKDASSQINNIVQQRINQAISQSGKELEQVLSKILRGAIEDVCQMPFQLLGNKLITD